MKKQWLVAGLIGLASVSVLTACGTAEKKEEVKQEATSKASESSTKESTKESTTESSSSSSSTKKSTKESTTESSSSSSSTKESASSSSSSSTKESSSSSASSSSSSAEKKETTTATTGFAAKTYADLDNLEFAINGKVYRVGETTLQTLIDDGVVFDDRTVGNFGNNVNPNSQSDTFHVVLADYWTLQIWTANFTEAGAVAKDLPISKIYLPLKPDKTQNVATLAVPFDVTIDALKANAGEPTEVDHYDGGGGYTSDTLEYQYESSQYYSKGGYQFDFVKEKLNGVYITYLPR